MDVKWHEARNNGMKTSHYEVWVGPHDGIEFVDKRQLVNSPMNDWVLWDLLRFV